MAEFQVVAGIILNDRGEIFITKRDRESTWGGYWEFPGGKIKAHENAYEALKRELREEVGIEVLKRRRLYTAENPTANIDRIAFDLIIRYSGMPFSNENQACAWAAPEHLPLYPMPPINAHVINALKTYMANKRAL